jgi:ABC-type antimicrobial peptide transport system permease subunit
MLFKGCAIGLVLSYFSGRLLVSFLYGVRSHDAWTTLAASVVLMSAGLAASYIPAKRAASIDPMEALRVE